jgi:hypothetical protein
MRETIIRPAGHYADGFLCLFQTGSSVLMANHMSQVTSVAFSKDGFVKIHLCGLIVNGILLLTPRFYILLLSVSLFYSETMISGGRDSVVNIWNIAAGSSYGTHLRTLPVYESVEGLSFLSSRPAVLGKKKEDKETYFVTGGSKGALRTWALGTLENVYTQQLPSATTGASASDKDAAAVAAPGLNAHKYIANQIAHLLHIPARKATAPADNSKMEIDGEAKQELIPREEQLIAVTQEQNFCTGEKANVK